MRTRGPNQEHRETNPCLRDAAVYSQTVCFETEAAEKWGQRSPETDSNNINLECGHNSTRY